MMIDWLFEGQSEKGTHESSLVSYSETSRSWSELYVRARHFALIPASWTTLDPMWPRQSAYGYVRGRATAIVDPKGLAAQASCGSDKPDDDCRRGCEKHFDVSGDDGMTYHLYHYPTGKPFNCCYTIPLLQQCCNLTCVRCFCMLVPTMSAELGRTYKFNVVAGKGTLVWNAACREDMSEYTGRCIRRSKGLL